MTRFVPTGDLYSVFDRRAQPDSIHGADMATVAKSRIGSMARVHSATSKTWLWPGNSQPDTYCPVSTITTADSWTPFKRYASGTTYDLQIPWRLADGCTDLVVMTTFVGPSNHVVYARLRTETLVDSVTTTYSKLTSRGEFLNGPMPDRQWEAKNYNGRFGSAVFNQTVAGVDVTSNRRIAIGVDAAALGNDPALSLGAEVVVYLHSIVVFDQRDVTAG